MVTPIGPLACHVLSVIHACLSALSTHHPCLCTHFWHRGLEEVTCEMSSVIEYVGLDYFLLLNKTCHSWEFRTHIWWMWAKHPSPPSPNTLKTALSKPHCNICVLFWVPTAEISVGEWISRLRVRSFSNILGIPWTKGSELGLCLAVHCSVRLSGCSSWNQTPPYIHGGCGEVCTSLNCAHLRHLGKHGLLLWILPW